LLLLVVIDKNGSHTQRDIGRHPAKAGIQKSLNLKALDSGLKIAGMTIGVDLQIHS